MREILFRGKRIDDNRWVEGGIMRKFHPNFPHESERDFYFQKENCYVICANNRDIFVAQNTIGQFTGLTDKNGKKIFEGDILKAIHYFHGSRDEFEKKKIRKAYGKAIKNKDSCLEEFTYFRNYAVEYSAKKCAWIGRNGSDQHELNSLTNCFHKGTVLGNIHDNPELLKGE